MLRLSRLIQPRNPLFWLLIVLNVLSSAITIILRVYDLPLAVTLALAAFAVGNFLVGITLAIRLMADPPALAASPAERQSA